MTIRVGWCKRCATEILEPSIPGSCGCLEGQLLRYAAQHRVAVSKVQKIEASLPRRGSLDHLASIPVVNPFVKAPQGTASNRMQVRQAQAPVPMQARAPQDMADFVQSIFTQGTDPQLVSDEFLSSLWSTAPGDDEIPGGAPQDDGLSALWSNTVAQEMGHEAAAELGDLDAVWMQELNSPTGSTVARADDTISFDIEFDEVDIDRELAMEFQPEAPRPVQRASAVSRVQSRAVQPRQVVGQARRFPIVAERPTIGRSEAVARDQQRQAERQNSHAHRPSQSILTKTAVHANKPTSFDQLMSDD